MKIVKYSVSKGKPQDGKVTSAWTLQQLHHMKYVGRNLSREGDRSTEALMSSGASEHFVRDSKLLQNMENISVVEVELADGNTAIAFKKGCVHVQVIHTKLILKCVYHIPTLHINVLS